MILEAAICRTRDGLPLAASTRPKPPPNSQLNSKEITRYIKMLSNRAFGLPPRSILNLHHSTIVLLTDKGLSCLVAVTTDYPVALAFGYLDRLLNNFTSKYNAPSVDSVQRPYHFIEFGESIDNESQKFSQRGGSLLHLSTDITSTTPYLVKLSEIEPFGRPRLQPNTSHLGVGGGGGKLEPLKWYCAAMILAQGILVGLGLYRSLASFQASSVEVYDGPSPASSLMFLIESLIRIFQLYLLLNYRRYREAESWFCTAVLFVCVFLLWERQGSAQQIVSVLSTVAMHTCIVSRRTRHKPPDYNV